MTESQEPAYLDPARDIDWDHDYVWVQASAWLTKADAQEPSKKGHLWVKSHDGAVFEISAAELEDRFMEVDAGRLWKPRYAPRKAHVLGSVSILEFGGGSAECSAGGAVLQRSDGGYEAINRERYLLGFQVVGFPGTAIPVMPFQPAETV